MKKRIIFVTVLSVAFALSTTAIAYQQTSMTPTAVTCCGKDDCCCKGDSCPMKKRAKTATTSDKDCCCKGDSCPMKKNAAAATSDKDCCCACCKSKAVKSAD